MKIRYDEHGEIESSGIDIYEKIRNLRDKYEEIFTYQVEETVFIYRPLGRKEFKELVANEELTSFDQEDIICKACVVWPEDYDFENCEAGIPTTLSKVILKNSLLDSKKGWQIALSYYRNEMFDLDNQITCIINEAFPEFPIEDIDAWGIAKTAKYLSRAEWKLQNLKGIPMNYDPFDEGQQEQEVAPKPEAPRPLRVQTQEIGDTPYGVDDEGRQRIREGNFETLEERQARLENMGGKKKMTPAELERYKKMYPEIDWENDAILRDGIEGLDKAEAVDIVAPAFRPNY